MESSFISGSLAGLITCTCVQPLDVIKTNILTLNQSLTIPQSIKYVKSQYGLLGFFRGLRPASYKAFLGSGMSFYYLETFKSLITASSFFTNSIIAMVSRGLTIVSLSPLSIIKVRMEAPQATAYKSVSDGILRIYKEEGIKGYYKGLTSCLLRDLPFSGLAYAFYQLFKDMINELFGVSNTAFTQVLAGAGAGLTATILTQPFDIIKTRQQFSHIAQNKYKSYNSIFDAMKKIYQNEGFKGFTIGLNVRLVERSSGFTIVWFLYEQIKGLNKTLKE